MIPATVSLIAVTPLAWNGIPNEDDLGGSTPPPAGLSAGAVPGGLEGGAAAVIGACGKPRMAAARWLALEARRLPNDPPPPYTYTYITNL